MALEYVFLCLFCAVSQCFGLGNKAVFSVKTGYDWVHSWDPNVPDGSDRHLNFTRGAICPAIHVNSLMRHGARLPTAEKMNSLIELRAKLLRSKPFDASGALETWTNDFDPEQELALVQVGRDEQYNLGVRYSQRFGDLFTHSLSDVEIISSSKARNLDSAKAFYNGMTARLTGGNTNREDQETFEPAVDDALTRFYEHCDRYDKTKQTFFKELTEYQESPSFQGVKDGISSRLGVTNYTLTTDDVNILYEMCANDLLIHGRDNLCRLMTDEERAIVEEEYDLQHYYAYSYGNNVSAKMACVVVKNMLTEMDGVIHRHRNNDSFNIGSFKIGHVHTMIGTHTALGLFADSAPLLASNIQSMADRKFRTSLTTPMSANVAFVLYSCPQGSGSQSNVYLVRAYVNEELVEIPACDNFLCPYDDVRKYYRDVIENCDRDGVCLNTSSGSPGVRTYALGWMLAVTIAGLILST